MPINYQALFDMSKSQDEGTRALASAAAKKLTPDEMKEFFAFQQASPHGDELHRQDNSFLGVPPELAVVGAVKGGQMAAQGAKMAYDSIPAGIGAATRGAVAKVPGAVRTGVGGYLGWEGANKVGDMLGLPGPLKTILSIMGAHMGSGIGGTAEAPLKGTLTPATSDAEFEAAVGRRRGAPLTFRNKPDPPNLERVPKASPTTAGASGRSVGTGVQVEGDVVRPDVRRKTQASEPSTESMGHTEAATAGPIRQREAYTEDPEMMRRIERALAKMELSKR